MLGHSFGLWTKAINTSRLLNINFLAGLVLQGLCEKKYQWKTLEIDVKRLNDYGSSFSSRSSEAVLIEADNCYRLLSDNTKLLRQWRMGRAQIQS